MFYHKTSFIKDFRKYNSYLSIPLIVSLYERVTDTKTQEKAQSIKRTSIRIDISVCLNKNKRSFLPTSISACNHIHFYTGKV